MDTAAVLGNAMTDYLLSVGAKTAPAARPDLHRRGHAARRSPSRLRPSLSDRDLAVLRAVAAGRCEMSTACGGSLTIDGLCCCDQFVGRRLASAGLIATPGLRLGPAQLTASGHALLGLA